MRRCRGARGTAIARGERAIDRAAREPAARHVCHRSDENADHVVEEGVPLDDDREQAWISVALDVDARKRADGRRPRVASRAEGGEVVRAAGGDSAAQDGAQDGATE